MIHHWRALDLENTDFEHHHDPTSSGEIIQSQTLKFKHVEIIKVSDKSTYDTSLESSGLADHRF